MNKILFMFVFLLWCTPFAFPCTTINLHGESGQIVGKNYDWMVERGMVIINKKGMQKKAMPSISPDPGPYATWVSKYGSLTFNQFGREFPNGGINEAGLVVESMELRGAIFPKPDSRPAIQILQWIQYQLDTSATVQDVINSDKSIRMLQGKGAGQHFLVADISGDCAVIEFLFEKQQVYTKDTLPVMALTNNMYEIGIANLKSYKGFGGTQPIPSGHESLNRFTRAAHMLKIPAGYSGVGLVNQGFKILDAAAQNSTLWKIIYDSSNQTVYFKSSSSPSIKHVDLSRLDFSCTKTPAMVIDINTTEPGDVTEKFEPYTTQGNFEVIREAFKKSYNISNIPMEYLQRRANYPESILCPP
jgi:choloylglycine hydrolase